MTRKLFSASDIIIILAVAVLAVSFLFTGTKSGSYVQISENGEVLYTLSLEKDREIAVGAVKIRVENKQAYIFESDCSDKTCIETGKLSKTSDAAICLPNRVSVRIIGEDNSGNDAVTY